MDKTLEEITKLTEEWYLLIGKEHHKDKDCHWYIKTVWSYGCPPKYTVQHWGYILRPIEQEFESYEEAAVYLKNTLIEKIKQEKNNQKDNEDLFQS